MQFNLGRFHAAIAHAGSLVFIRAGSLEFHLFRSGRPQGAPWADSWADAGCRTVRLGEFQMEAAA